MKLKNDTNLNTNKNKKVIMKLQLYKYRSEKYLINKK